MINIICDTISCITKEIAERDEGAALASDLGNKVNQPIIPIANIPPAIVTHAGPGVLGVGFFVRE